MNIKRFCWNCFFLSCFFGLITLLILHHLTGEENINSDSASLFLVVSIVPSFIFALIFEEFCQRRLFEDHLIEIVEEVNRYHKTNLGRVRNEIVLYLAEDLPKMIDSKYRPQLIIDISNFCGSRLDIDIDELKKDLNGLNLVLNNNYQINKYYDLLGLYSKMLWDHTFICFHCFPALSFENLGDTDERFYLKENRVDLFNTLIQNRRHFIEQNAKAIFEEIKRLNSEDTAEENIKTA